MLNNCCWLFLKITLRQSCSNQVNSESGQIDKSCEWSFLGNCQTVQMKNSFLRMELWRDFNLVLPPSVVAKLMVYLRIARLLIFKAVVEVGRRDGERVNSNATKFTVLTEIQAFTAIFYCYSITVVIFLIVTNLCSSPGWCGSVDWMPSGKPKGRQFDSQSGHMPGLWARSTVGGVQEATTHRWFFASFSPFLPLSLKINK